jgi:hypothetical protein
LLESRRDKAVNEELQNLYDILLFSVESEFDVARKAVSDQIELSLNRFLRPTTTPGGNLTFFKDPDEYSISMADRHQTYSAAIPSTPSC